jgi:membrane fusion protein (multidrug efflux system)
LGYLLTEPIGHFTEYAWMDGDALVAERQKSMTQGGQGQGQGQAPRKRRALPFIVLLVIFVAMAAGGTLWWLNARHYASTDDAFIDTNISQVSSQIAGRTLRILADDNELVKQGQVLVELDPRDMQVKLDQATAQRANAAAMVAQAQAQVAVQQASIDQAQANARVTEADLRQAQLDMARYRAIDPKAVTKQTVDNADAALRSSQAKLDANHQLIAVARAQLSAAQAQLQAAEASLKNADVGVENAELQLSYTKITAPQDGRVAKRNVEPGNVIGVGQSLLAVVPQETWVTANFKETQLGDMRPGQPVDIAVDTYPDIVFHGKVDSIQSGTGSVFSSLPVENATGNWVKVLQRIPVKIVFDQAPDKDHPLAPGMSVTATVTVR